VTISGPERPKVRIFRSEGRNVVDFVEKVTISRVGQAFPGGLRGPQSAFPSFSTGLATPKGRGFQNRPFFGSVWPDFSEKVTISGPGSPKVRFSGLRVEMSSISRPGGEKVTISGSGHRYFVKSRQFGGARSEPVTRKVACHRAILSRQDRLRSTLRTSKCVTFRPRFGDILPPDDTRAQTGVFWGVKTY